MVLLIFVSFAACVFWLYAEKKLGVNARVGAALACMVLVGYSVYVLATIIPRYERSFTRNSMRLVGELISKGETQRVQQAVAAYNKAASNNTYRASMEMWHVLIVAPQR
jgi:hypothetical protein